MAITYSLEKQAPLTAQELDDNFRSLYYSSSLHDNGTTLRLHYDTQPGTFSSIPLAGGSGVSISGNINNQILTATGTPGSIQGESNFTFDGNNLTLIGRLNIKSDSSEQNIFIGENSGINQTTGDFNIGLGANSLQDIEGFYNTGIGVTALENAKAASKNLAAGYESLLNFEDGNFNTALGAEAGKFLTSGTGNVFLGYNSGPSTDTVESNKLYISNNSGTPLIQGDFSTGQVTISNSVTASTFTGSFIGDGSSLTGVTATAAWNGNLEGDANITGSLIVSGGLVDFLNTSAITGSTFTGSFVGDGSNLTNLPQQQWDGVFTGDSEITGSLTISGSGLTVEGPTVLDQNIKIDNKKEYGLRIGFNALENNISDFNIGIGHSAGVNSSQRDSTLIGYRAGVNTKGRSVGIGNYTLGRNSGEYNIALGFRAMGNSELNSSYNIGIGFDTLYYTSNTLHNIAIGSNTLKANRTGNNNTVVGSTALTQNLGSDNTALGFKAGRLSINSSRNVYIGLDAGPSIVTNESDKLYISNKTGTPLIGGDFQSETVNIQGTLSVSSSITATEFIGDGSQITGVTGEWDGSHFGDASITGSLTVSGSNVDFSNTTSITGSTFTGSFVGDGSNLTGITAPGWNGIRSGSSVITGSLDVTEGLNIAQNFTITSSSIGEGALVEYIHLDVQNLNSDTDLYTFPIDSANAYTGFKADYSLHNAGEDEKKVGTIHGAWDLSGGSTINDSSTDSIGDIITSNFEIDSTSTSEAIFKFISSPGTYNLNMIITAFKKAV